MLTYASIRRLATPVYFLQPVQIARRAWAELFPTKNRNLIIALPWGVSINVQGDEAIGRALMAHGLYDPALTETLWRLTDPGDSTIDAGANMGYATSVLAARAGSSGRVLSFEPHPEVFRQLEQNVANWNLLRSRAHIEIENCALGERNGTGFIHVSDYFLTNKGTAWVTDKESETTDKAPSIPISMKTLDSVLGQTGSIGMLKIDVQGFEINVLRGAERALSSGRVRDIVFEVSSTPGEAHEFLASKGFALFGIRKSALGVCVDRNATPKSPWWDDSETSYLATIVPERAESRFQSRFWQSFGPRMLLQRLFQ